MVSRPNKGALYMLLRNPKRLNHGVVSPHILVEETHLMVLCMF
jgi:hypothetical protein